MAPAQPNSQAVAPQLYLRTPPIENAAGFLPKLAAALDAADIAAVLLTLCESDERSQINCVKALAAAVQGKGVALVIDGRPGLVARGGADGAHLTGAQAFSDALDTLKPERIAGCGGLASRHDAMVAAERGADYVMFGDTVGGRRASFAAIEARVGWWAEVFEVPCVAAVESLDEIGRLAAAGADFIAVGDFIWIDPGGADAALRAAAAKLSAPETVA